ncbi:MAG: hypothetical protein ACM3QZ_15310 [Solirubrobacterales bacterium]
MPRRQNHAKPRDLTILIPDALSPEGKICAEAFAEIGARLILCANDPEGCESLVAELRWNYGIDAIHCLPMAANQTVAELIHTLPPLWQQVDLRMMLARPA